MENVPHLFIRLNDFITSDAYLHLTSLTWFKHLFNYTIHHNLPGLSHLASHSEPAILRPAWPDTDSLVL